MSKMYSSAIKNFFLASGTVFELLFWCTQLGQFLITAQQSFQNLQQISIESNIQPGLHFVCLYLASLSDFIFAKAEANYNVFRDSYFQAFGFTIREKPQLLQVLKQLR